VTSVLIQPSLASRLGDLGGGQLLDTSSDAAKNLAARAMVLGSQGKKNGVAQIELEGL
jgi:heme oxygenase